MSTTPILHLAHRALVRLSGSEAESLLQRLITTDLDDVSVGDAGYGALLTPQGKILMDFLVTRQSDGFLFDLDQDQLEAFVKKMTLYRMRSDVTIEPMPDSVGVSLKAIKGAIRDPRATQLGWRIYGDRKGWQSSDALKNDYLERYIEAVVPQSGVDFTPGDVFPHDINFDFLGGLDFEKGCYVGQEVVSRMQHRGTARRRLVRITSEQALPATGTPITADGKVVGALGTVAGNKALAQVRIDRVSEANGAGTPLQVEEIQPTVEVPDYANFTID
ncbi:CAF17-like 4Fe-4S cluster assembly/insertion protein YgfZ [Cohaesibacter celericrescens]|uniref:CAF17-like 4Fe-4S cluster assembly/insertion protein YgfZ n=1 Tax=Cohaesibacter celericrescens TaxID=2067669 RepID=UPI00356AD0D1